ncbi:hypothetical protein M2146_000057 [Lachnospiraceae bacterium PF1-22]|uniref:NUDIX hydrolase n=1 Tax=Ohessyouella blattaphilus TaxID=2949333 RepID=UPI003E1DDB33
MKYVYLFELDSVRKTDIEIEIGQQAMYNEIVDNGNVVVLTYNQLVDSRGFFSLLENHTYYENLIALFEKGAIRISQYGDIRTIAQYLINSFDHEKQFIYSGWPLKSTQKRLLALIKRSLTFSDLSEINTFIESTKKEDEILDLFIEVSNDTLTKTTFNLNQCRQILKHLYWLLKTVLRLSAIHSIYIPPRDIGEYQNFRLHNILEFALDLSAPVTLPHWREAVKIIRALSCYGNDNRSVYLHEIKLQSRTPGVDKKAYQYAESIINLCYNYACEISICNTSKHYNINEFASSSRPTFEADFLSRLEQSWQLGHPNERFLQDECCFFVSYSKNNIVDFSEAVRITDYISRPKDIAPENIATENISRYEFDIANHRKNQRRQVLSSIGSKFVFSLLCIAIACAVEVGFQFIPSWPTRILPFSGRFRMIIETIFSLFLMELITTLFAKKVPKLLSLSDALGGIGQLFVDAFHFLFRKTEIYLNKNYFNIDQKECFNKCQPIDIVTSSAMKRYIHMKKEPKYSSLFQQSDVYPLIESEQHSSIKKISRLEELFNYRFGIVYKSQYNTLCVDPIKTSDDSFFPYERIIPTAGNGVVMLTLCRGKYVLLNQYRHALRENQLCFPRGYGEPGLFSEENAKKELREELNASITKAPIKLGTVSPDSGLTTSLVDVFLVEIDNYSPNVGHEGITNIIELSENDFKRLICQGDSENSTSVNDSFTLSAYLLYKKYLANHL